MIIYSRVKVAPASEPVTLAEAKDWLRIDAAVTTEDAIITRLISAAREMCEAYTGLSFVKQTRLVKLDRFPAVADIILPYGPVLSIEEFGYMDEYSENQVLDDADYLLDTNSSLARVQTISGWPDTDSANGAVSLSYVAGYDVDQVPATAKQAILHQTAALYENRGDGGELIWSARILLDTIKVYWDAWG